METKIITRETQRRLIKDIKELIIHPLTEDGIYYTHDESNILTGYALIIGPKETIYADGFFFFKFNIPFNYPYSPPKVTFHTQGGNIRFNPNLYKNGKVCLSILNTWKGEQWTSCQTLRSILLTLVTLFHNKPLLNEPGLTESYHAYDAYNKVIEYSTYNIAIFNIVNQIIPPEFCIFFPFIREHFLKEYPNILNRLEELIEKNPLEMRYSISIYCMKDIIVNYKEMKDKMMAVYHTFNILKNENCDFKIDIKK